MSYVERVLQPGEQVRHISSIHWIVFWPGVIVALLAAVVYWFKESLPVTIFWLYTAYALALIALFLLVQEWFRCWITEIAVTDRRVIYKKGFIWRHRKLRDTAGGRRPDQAAKLDHRHLTDAHRLSQDRDSETPQT